MRLGRYRLAVGGDIITAFDGQPAADGQDLMVYLETQTTSGDRVELTVLQDGAPITIPVTLRLEPSG